MEKFRVNDSFQLTSFSESNFYGKYSKKINREIDLFDVTSFFGLDFFKISDLCILCTET